jgi:hypothetical protein
MQTIQIGFFTQFSYYNYYFFCLIVLPYLNKIYG